MQVAWDLLAKFIGGWEDKKMNKICYRIYTENKNLTTLKEIISRHFLSYTLLEAKGIWNRQEEESLIIEIIGEEAREGEVNQVAKEIKAYNQQEAVLITKGQVASRLV